MVGTHHNLPAACRVSHYAYLHDRKHRREVHAAFHRLAKKKGLQRITVVHRTDGACCELEPWPVTHVRILRALADDGLRAAGLLARRVA